MHTILSKISQKLKIMDILSHKGGACQLLRWSQIFCFSFLSIKEAAYKVLKLAMLVIELQKMINSEQTKIVYKSSQIFKN